MGDGGARRSSGGSRQRWRVHRARRGDRRSAVRGWGNDSRTVHSWGGSNSPEWAARRNGLLVLGLGVTDAGRNVWAPRGAPLHSVRPRGP